MAPVDLMWRKTQRSVYRKDGDGKEWKVVSNGLLEPSRATIMTFASNQKVLGEFYAVNNRDIFISTDSGDSWGKLDTLWPREYLQQTPWAFAINEN